jgi:hypothetical protein
MLVIVLAAIAFEVAFAPREKQRTLDPDQPIAADGSMIAGRALTIYDTNPLLGAFGWPRPDPDDPKEFQWLIENDRVFTERGREAMAKFIGPLGAALCEDATRRGLIEAVRTYYGTRGREKYGFSLRGPHAKAAIEAEWSTPLDQRIDAFVRQAVQSGYLHKNEVPANVYPEFTKVLADTREIGTTCPPLKSNNGVVKLQDTDEP